MDLNENKKMSKEIDAGRAKSLKLSIKYKLDKYLERDSGIERIPDEILKTFLGNINSNSITGIATFAILNNLDYKAIEIILGTIKQNSKNTMKQTDYKKIARRINLIRGMIQKKKAKMQEWKKKDDQQKKKPQDQREEIPKPEKLNYYSYDMMANTYKDIEGNIIGGNPGRKNKKQQHQKQEKQEEENHIKKYEITLDLAEQKQNQMIITLIEGNRKKEIIVNTNGLKDIQLNIKGDNRND